MADSVTGSGGQPCLFLAVASGQNIANLPPILEYGSSQRGDAVVWLESPQAQASKWADRANKVLRGRGFRILPSQVLPDEPPQAIAQVRDALRTPEWAPFRLCLVGNGGTKVTALALDAALAERSPPVPILYGNVTPCEVWELPQGAKGPLVRRAYTRLERHLTLQDIIDCNRRLMKNPENAKRFWPSGFDLGSDGYGVDLEITKRAHEEAETARAAREGQDRIGSGGSVTYVQLTSLDNDLAGQWGRAVWESARTLLNAGAFGRMPDNWPAFATAHARPLDVMFNTALRGAERAIMAARSRPVPDRLGPRFEKAVARRVRSWLERNKSRLPVVEAWLNVELADEGAPDIARIELDVSMVLANGVLIVLECKTPGLDSKDYNSRLLNLYRSSSQLARLHVCPPLYTALAAEPWFMAQHQRFKVFERDFPPAVPFTLEGQPESYDVSGQGFRCEPFEKHLDRIFKQYLPGDEARNVARAAADAEQRLA